MESLITAAKGDVEIPNTIGQDDLEVVEMVAEQCDRLVAFEMELRDEKARVNNMRRDIQEGVAPQVTRFDLRLGDKVSLDGRTVTITALTGQEGVSQTTEVETQSGVRKKVQYRDLRPLAVGRPSRGLPQEAAEQGQFVMWKDDDAEWVAGIVIGRVGDTLRVHRQQGSGTGVSWLPLWWQGAQICRQEARPDGAEAMIDEVDAARIEVSGSLTEKHRVCETLRRRMEDLEII